MKTRLTEFFGIEHPIVSAPMALTSGGKLAAAVSSSGGLGLIGGGYGDSDWVAREFGLADGARVGCGFITWSLARNPDLLDETLERQPATIMLSFGDLHPFARAHPRGRGAAHCAGSDTRPRAPGSGRRRADTGGSGQ